ncbi:MAG TPA: hypothetical protein VM308_03305 [Sphingomicrobium sp.]|nr:hypothetical protein [Sphingomicrobium sp.]
MRNAINHILLAAVAATALGACREQRSQDQNITVDNGVMANADIEALPPDESSVTPSDELANGAVEPPADENASGNRY